MNAHQRRVARRKNDFRTFDLGGVQVNIYGPKSAAYRAALRRLKALRVMYGAARQSLKPLGIIP